MSVKSAQDLILLWHCGVHRVMRVIDTGTAALSEPSVVCLGYFDGVHRGHKALIEAAKEIADNSHLTCCVHALDRSPAQVLYPERTVPLLTTMEEKIRLFAEAQVDVLAITSFDDHVRHLPGRVFFEEILLGRLNARAIVAGDDHRFGYRGDTGSAELARMCGEKGIELTVVPRVTLEDGSVISSSAIRAALEQGDLQRAQEMLGREPDAEMLRHCAGEQREAVQSL